MKIVVTDQRSGAVDLKHRELHAADVIISIDLDGIHVVKNHRADQFQVDVIVGKSEPELSMARALAEKAARNDARPADQPTHTVEQHLSRVFGDDDGSPREGRLDKSDDFLS
jgi:hypothetical protein